MSLREEIVFVVDDDARVREAIGELLESRGWRAETFAAAADYIAYAKPNLPACLILDVELPDINGLEFQRQLSRDVHPPIVFITGHGDIPSSVRAIQGGAVDFLTKPVDEDGLMRAVDAALARARVLRKEAEHTATLQALYRSLTPREQELMPLLTSGMLNKQIAANLGITEYTVQVHRSHIMRKMQADTFATLVRQAGKLQLDTSPTTTMNA